MHDVCVLFQICMMQYRNFKRASLIQDRDKSNTGKISFDQLGDIFRIYQVKTNAFNASNDVWDQVELNAVNVEKYLDNQGWLTRDDFVKIAQDHKLLELNERQGVTG